MRSFAPRTATMENSELLGLRIWLYLSLGGLTGRFQILNIFKHFYSFNWQPSNTAFANMLPLNTSVHFLLLCPVLICLHFSLFLRPLFHVPSLGKIKSSFSQSGLVPQLSPCWSSVGSIAPPEKCGDSTYLVGWINEWHSVNGLIIIDNVLFISISI